MPRVRPRNPGPDPSQRPRREAPGMLTGLAILERDLGITEYTRHKLARQLAGRPAKAEADAVRKQLRDLKRRREQALRLLDEMHEDGEGRASQAS